LTPDFEGSKGQSQLSLIRDCMRLKRQMFSGLHREEVCQQLLSFLLVRFGIIYAWAQGFELFLLAHVICFICDSVLIIALSQI